jgi:hypothetical protein
MKLTTIFITAVFVLCSFIFGNNRQRHIKAADACVKPLLKTIEKDFQLGLIGYGGAMMLDVEGFDIHLASNQQLDLQSARRMYISIMERLLAAINQDKSLRTYLAEYPFPASRLEVMLSPMFYTPEQSKGDLVSLIFMIDNRIVYSKETSSRKHVNMHEETYDEALRIVRGNEITSPQ